MRSALFIIAAVLQVVCRAQEDCKIFPKNPVVPYGSALTMFIKAPSSSDCHSKMPFNPSRIFWTLNKIKIDERFYDFNATFLSVSIRNLTVEQGTVECFSNTSVAPVLLHGTFVRTYPLVRSPQNVSCIGKMYNPLAPAVTCMWDHDKQAADIKYTVCLNMDKEHCYGSWENNFTFPDNITVLLSSQINVRVTAQNSYGYSASSNELTYNIWDIVQLDAPEDVTAEPVPTGLRISWKIEEYYWNLQEDVKCEVQIRENGSDAKPVVISVRNGVSTKEVTEVKPCTNYTISVRSRYQHSVWSPWSHEVTALSSINVNNIQFHLWRSRSVLGDKGKRTIHLMWKGVPISCKAVDMYCISSNSPKVPECFGPYQSHSVITLDQHPHRITVAAFRNDTKLNEASIEVPAMAKEVDLPPVRNINVFIEHGFINITWTKPKLLVSGYIIVWNNTAKNHMWHRTQKNCFTLLAEPSTIYTISLIPLYKDGPGNEIILHNCSQERNLPAVSTVQVTGLSDQHAEIHWLPLFPSQCCAPVLNYTVFYKTHHEPKTRYVTAGPSQHHVILEDLQARTTFSVYVMASTVDASSMSVPIIFSTKPSKSLFIVLILCSVVLILLAMLAVMIQRKLASKKIPDPRFSSLSMWPSEKCKYLWSLYPVPMDKGSENILPCHVDSEVIRVSPTSRHVMAVVKTLTEIPNISTSETSQTQSTPLAASCSNEEAQPIHGGKAQRIPLIPSLDFQMPGISPQEVPLPHIQSPYRKQTPLSSPAQSPTTPPWSDETETLLTPKLKNTTFFTSYVTLDMTESGKLLAK